MAPPATTRWTVRTYTLDEINDGYEAMRNGENVQGVIVFNETAGRVHTGCRQDLLT